MAIFLNIFTEILLKHLIVHIKYLIDINKYIFQYIFHNYNVNMGDNILKVLLHSKYYNPLLFQKGVYICDIFLRWN